MVSLPTFPMLIVLEPLQKLIYQRPELNFESRVDFP